MSSTLTSGPADPAAESVVTPSPRQRDLRRRIVRHFFPIALASTVAMVVFLNVDFFDANRYPPPADIMVEGLSGAIGPQGGTPMGASMHADETAEPDANNAAPDAATPAPDAGATGGHTPPAGGHGATEGDPALGTMTPDVTGGAAAPDQASGEHEAAGDSARLLRKYATGTGYVALVLLAFTLLVGPVKLMRGQRSPLSSYLARDVGLAAATFSIGHVVFGFLTDHGGGFLSYFFESDDRSRILTTSFGVANWVGAAAVLIVAALAAISSDWALRKLKARRWKRIQRLNYLLFALVVAHAVFYGALLRLTSPYTALLGVCLVAVLAGQIIGIYLWRQRARRSTTGDGHRPVAAAPTTGL